MLSLQLICIPFYLFSILIQLLKNAFSLMVPNVMVIVIIKIQDILQNKIRIPIMIHKQYSK